MRDVSLGVCSEGNFMGENLLRGRENCLDLHTGLLFSMSAVLKVTEKICREKLFSANLTRVAMLVFINIIPLNMTWVASCNLAEVPQRVRISQCL